MQYKSQTNILQWTNKYKQSTSSGLHIGLGLWYFTPLSTFQQYFSYMVAVSFIGTALEYLEKTTDLLQVTDKLLSHNVVSSTPRHERDSNSQC
jgi:purine-nucleoside phosphorylase